MPTERTVEEQWYRMLTEGEPINRHLYYLYRLLPSDPCCKMCAAPFGGLGGFIMHCSAEINPNTIHVSASLLKNLNIPAVQ